MSVSKTEDEMLDRIATRVMHSIRGAGGSNQDVIDASAIADEMKDLGASRLDARHLPDAEKVRLMRLAFVAGLAFVDSMTAEVK